ncbi:MAG: hypothetical protein RSE46_20390, partial [Janthinobacterium sp.]
MIHTRSLSSFHARCLKNKYLIRHLGPADGKKGPSWAFFHRLWPACQAGTVFSSATLAASTTGAVLVSAGV